MYDMNDITINTFNKGVDVEQWMADVVGWMKDRVTGTSIKTEGELSQVLRKGRLFPRYAIACAQYICHRRAILYTGKLFS
jgi:hypothetical protein